MVMMMVMVMVIVMVIVKKECAYDCFDNGSFISVFS